ncbi:hypothetical protein ACHAWF_003932 [Thalassiosira exigua]
MTLMRRSSLRRRGGRGPSCLRSLGLGGPYAVPLLLLLGAAALLALATIRAHLRLLGRIDASEPAPAISSPSSRQGQEFSRRSRAAAGRGGASSSPSPADGSARLDGIVEGLTVLAELPPSELWTKLGMDGSNDGYGEDPFSLRELEAGRCPPSSSRRTPGGTEGGRDDATTTTTPWWLPPRPANSDAIAAAFRSDGENLQEVDDDANGTPSAVVCGPLARAEVSLYAQEGSYKIISLHCHGAVTFHVRYTQQTLKIIFPKKGELMDGRVGSWSNVEVTDRVREDGHGIVSSEWDPFSLEKLKLSGRSLHGGEDGAGGGDGNGGEGGEGSGGGEPRLLFLTTLRDPSDRLLSAYTFFSGTANKNKKKGGGGPTFDKWIDANLKRAKNWKSSMKRWGFRSNTARINHLTWRFSGGELPATRKLAKGEWEGAFATAVRALAQHDLVLPLDLLSKDEGHRALEELLGWTNFEAKGRQIAGDREGGHVVTVGGIRNSKAREYFDDGKYRELWEGNWLDDLLVAWCRAVFLARVRGCDGD